MPEQTAIVFPGQGAQRHGMGRDFMEAFPESKRIFDLASDTLNMDVAALCHGEDERLNLTAFTQPCILTTEVAMLEGLRAEQGIEATFFGGHSLGEYTALVAAGVIPFEIAVRLVHLRGQLMQDAVPAGEGAMAALSRTEALPVKIIANCAHRHDVDVANHNSPNQIVLSGQTDAVNRAVAAIEAEVEELKVTLLNVSAPFHSRHMAVIEEDFKNALEAVSHCFDTSKATCVTSNFIGDFHSGSESNLVSALTRQISGSVRWTDNMKVLCSAASNILEIGPNRPLRRFFGALDTPIKSIIDLRSARRAFRNAA